ncbi:hypothetical protein [Halodesulfovibrio sp.]|jgi:hypothetical protein|uniref:hypothetical protein n=1 Tax=Halodesulfovibrio sp. TaxID=1912772 RepID=UPI0025D7DD87|nr:hypothetical protein [Halodesulfovibrio sp.]MCT4535234.1 hypothetical protein [Halodesulfovibrio sp.]MCT4625432.1 hypothetical protein [Halodesulfovibrio sp.]
MKRGMIRLTAALAVCTALLFTSLSPAFAAGDVNAKWGWHTASVEEVGITGPDNWFAVLKSDSGTTTRVTFVQASIRKELLAVALTAKSSGMKVKGYYQDTGATGNKTVGCKGLYITK